MTPITHYLCRSDAVMCELFRDAKLNSLPRGELLTWRSSRHPSSALTAWPLAPLVIRPREVGW